MERLGKFVILNSLWTVLNVVLGLYDLRQVRVSGFHLVTRGAMSKEYSHDAGSRNCLGAMRGKEGEALTSSRRDLVRHDVEEGCGEFNVIPPLHSCRG